MERCEHYEELMSRLMDEGLSPQEEADLRAHIRACPDCARLFSALSGITVSLRDDMAEPPAALAAGVMARIAAEQQSAAPFSREAEGEEPEPVPVKPVSAAKRRPAVWVRVAAAACLVLAVSGAALTAIRGGMGKAAGTESAQLRYASAGGAVTEGSAETEAADAAVPMPASALSGTEEQLEVLDIAGDSIGYIPPEDIAAFAALLEDGGTTEEQWDILCTVEYDGVTYAFATDDAGQALVWWDTAEGISHLSPGTWPELRALIVSTVNTEAGE